MVAARKRGGRSPCAKAQISMEYLAVVGLSIMLMFPIIIIFYEQSTSLKDDISATQIEKIGIEIMDAAEEVYYLGPPSTKYLTAYLPEGVQSITFNSQEILFSYLLSGTTITYPIGTDLPLNLTGAMAAFPGQHRISVEAKENGVVISDGS